ncbi:unnamed protein product, partial [Oncorhynchus mykiss]
MDAGLVTSLHRTSSIQGLLGQHLSSSQLSFSSSVVMAPLPGPGSFLDGGHRGSGRAGLGHGLPYEGLYGKWSMSGRKGFNGPAAAESDGGASQFIRTQSTPPALPPGASPTQDPLGVTQSTETTLPSPAPGEDCRCVVLCQKFEREIIPYQPYIRLNLQMINIITWLGTIRNVLGCGGTGRVV